MSNPMINPNYSGVTIQISNPAVNVGQQGAQIPNSAERNAQYATCPSCCCCQPAAKNEISNYYQNGYTNNYPEKIIPYDNVNTAQQNAEQVKDRGYTTSYPAEYYLNNYNTNPNNSYQQSPKDIIENPIKEGVPQEFNPSAYRAYAENNAPEIQDFTKSNGIINELDERNAQLQEEKKNTKETKVVALTDAYIKSLENYLNNPNDDIRLMASKEILTRLDEDKNRYDDAALNALLNKMLQDPSKLVRIAALSAFSSQLASGNDYTVKLLQNIQANPNADKEDVLQAADILLKMTAGTEVKNVPVKKQENNVPQNK